MATANLTDDVTKRFVAALGKAEEARDAAPLVELFADDAELESLSRHDTARGADGAKQFWTEYLHAFASVRSTFGMVVANGSAAVLEWTSSGTLPNGKPVEYRGVSILEVDGDRVKKFRTYYDTAPFVAPTKG